MAGLFVGSLVNLGIYALAWLTRRLARGNDGRKGTAASLVRFFAGLRLVGPAARSRNSWSSLLDSSPTD